MTVNPLLRIIVGALLSMSLLSTAFALEGDKDQPATLDADEFDMDFQTGVRTYRGNVIYQQGSIRLYSDELIAYFKDGQLLRAVARGNRAEFRQRPDDSEFDVIGVALRIELDDVKQLVTLDGKAKVTQDENTITGKIIVYNMATEKVKVRSGGSRKKPAATRSPSSAEPAASEESTARPRIVIKPKKK